MIASSTLNGKRRSNCPARIGPALVLVLSLATISLDAADPTEDGLEYRLKPKDARFLPRVDEEIPRDFNTPFDMIAAAQAAVKRDFGVRLYFDYYGVFLGNVSGGLSREVGYTHEIVIGGQFDLEKIVGWRGASFTASFADGAGHNLSQNVGNYFTVSESYVENTGVLFDLYLTQKLLDDRLDLRIGRMSAGQFFATLPAFGLQVSGGINGNPANLFSNAPFHAGITSTWAGVVKFKPTHDTYLSSGIFQATPRLGVYAYHGTDFSIRPGDGILMMFEAGWKPTFGAHEARPPDGKGAGKEVAAPADPGLPGIYKLGGYYSNYTFDEFSGGTACNAYGFYAMAQQMVWRSARDANHNFSLWGGLVYSPQENLALMPVMGSAGAIWQGLVPGRDHDQLLFCWLIGNFSNDYGDSPANPSHEIPTYETVFETSYVIQLNKYLSIQPDVQYVVRPSGYGSIPNAWVIGMQATVSF